MTRAMTRDALVAIAQTTVDALKNPPYRAVVIVTDASGEWVGVGMNTALDDGIRIMRAALVGEELVFHDVDEGGKHSRRMKKKRTPQRRSVRQSTGPEEKR
jgi:hypothetical protein